MKLNVLFLENDIGVQKWDLYEQPLNVWMKNI